MGFSLSGILGLLLIGYCLYDYSQRRPEFFWLFIILFFPGLGPIAYLVINVLPDLTSGGGAATSILRSINPQQRLEYRRLKKRVDDESPIADVEQLMVLSAKFGNPEETIRYADRVLQNDPESLSAKYSAGLAHMELAQYDEAERYLKDVLGEDQKYDYGLAYLALAEMYKEQGRREEALEAFKVVTKQSSYLEAQYLYGEMLWEDGQNKEALQWMKRVERAGRDLPKFKRKQDMPWVKKAKAFLKVHG